MATEFAGVSEVVGQRVNEVRRKRGFSAVELAKRCSAAGAPDLTRQKIFNIESGRPGEDGNRRRHVTVDELCALAYVLDVAPIHLLVPLESDVTYPITTTETADVNLVRAWVRGIEPLSETNRREYFREVPDAEIQVVHPSSPQAQAAGFRPLSGDAVDGEER